ncbi:hypothetical protein GGX14DRAFT_693793 [Mycena pura]|uniref:Uncharacterized protein n=1 Tax=Mycena pura TaxID=153505 RepID=A0AAD7E351_9AGAR|nr:hypothetical protein GGX14DRAFT_693793 [Mycena pura]
MAISFARIDTHRPYSQLWRLIIDSCDVMGKEYCDIFECDWDKIPAQYQDLATDLVFVLNNAGVSYDLERFRCLRRFRIDITRLPESTSNSSNVSGKGTWWKSFFQDFRGGHDVVLLNTLDRYYQLSQNCTDDSDSEEASHDCLEKPWPYYSLTVPFVQSSCTGKTRTAYEVVRKRFGLNICLREPVKEYPAYPPTDHQVRDYLTVLDSNHFTHIVIRYRLFLIELFRHTVYTLDSKAFSQWQAKYETLSEAWSSWFEEGSDSQEHGANHQQFYNEVTSKARESWTGLGKDYTSNKVAMLCRAASKKLINKLKEYEDKKRHTYIGEDQNRVEFVIFFDEAHSLSQLTVEESSSPKGTRRTGLSAMERAFECLLNRPIFAVFMSTNAKLEGPVTPCSPHYQYFLPLSEFAGFDLFAGEVSRKLFESGVTLQKLCDPMLIASFGRPHWYGLWVAFDDTPEKRLDKILKMARQKLNPDLKSERDMNTRLAWIGNRLCLQPDIHRAEGRAFQSRLIESYMGIVVSVPEHKLFMHTTTTSEPVLVEASGRLMDDYKVDMFKLVRENLGEGLLAKGERGEIVTRALMVLAHDTAARDEGEMHGLQYCRPIRLLAFLRALLTDSAHDTMMEATQALPTAPEKKFVDVFQNAWINISHFVRAGDLAVVRTEHLRNFFSRGAAVQWHPTEEAIDCVAPLVHAATPESLISSADISILQLQTKNLLVTTHQIRPELSPDDQPTISILIEYGDENTIDKSNCIEITHTTTSFRPQTMNYQVTLRGLEAFRLSEEQKTDIRSLLDLTSALETFPRASRPDNVALMRRLKPDFKAGDVLSLWAATDCWN